MERKLKIRNSPLITLSGETLQNYVKILKRLVRGGRTNKYFPDGAAFCNMLDFYLPENNHGMYDTLEINLDTGLPSEKEVTRLVTDRQIAPKTMKEDPEAKLRQRATSTPSQVNVRRLNRYLYHKELLDTPILPLMDLKLKLRSVDTDQYIAYFNVEVLRLDVADSLFAKYTLVAGQSDSRWKQQVHVAGDELKYTGKFRNLISRYSVDEAEFTFILLNELEDVAVEEVQRCRLGPLYFRGARIPVGMEALFKAHPDAFILSLPTDRVSIHIKEDANNDPLSGLYRETLDPEDKKMMDEKAKDMDYNVYKERKFVCTRSVLRDFRKFLKERKARCVVYGV